MSQRIKLFFISFLILLSSCVSSSENKTIPNNLKTITIATFNIQIFGTTKASKPKVMDILAKIIRRYDLVAIQEIRNADGTAIVALNDKVNEDGDYAYIVGERLGRSRCKEQYCYMYKNDTIELLGTFYTYDDDNDGNNSNNVDDTLHDDDFEREPMLAHFTTKEGNFDFVLGNIHVKPSDATNEISKLSDVFTDASNHFSEKDIIILGDYNADGSYFDENTYLNYFPEDTYSWIIPNDIDTTLAASDNTYDRFVSTISVNEDYTGSYGVLRFDEIYDFSSPIIKPANVSDHYPVWVKFYVEKDSD